MPHGPSGGPSGRLVTDTNTVVSGFLWHGPPFRLMEAARAGVVELFTSPTLLAELQDVLRRPKFSGRLTSGGFTAAGLFNDYVAVSNLVVPTTSPSIVAADPDDDAVLACAVAAKADAIVSGDRHLLALGSYQGIPILTAAAMLARITPPSP
jgi:putative PIN family toxin of toxin-antitoxin system